MQRRSRCPGSWLVALQGSRVFDLKQRLVFDANGFDASSGSIGCTAYILTFDQEKILRDWQWQPSCPQRFRP